MCYNSNNMNEMILNYLKIFDKSQKMEDQRILR